MNPGPSASSGFTLLEIMVVMVVLTMVTAFAMPSLRSALFSDQLKATARQLEGLVAETGQEAIRSQTEQLLHFDLERQLVWTSSEKPDKGRNPDAVWDTNPVWEEDAPLQARRLTIPASVRVVDISSVSAGKRSAGSTVIRFSTKGYVDKTLIHLRDDEGRDLTLILSPFLAVTRVLDSYAEIDDEKVNY